MPQLFHPFLVATRRAAGRGLIAGLMATSLVACGGGSAGGAGGVGGISGGTGGGTSGGSGATSGTPDSATTALANTEAQAKSMAQSLLNGDEDAASADARIDRVNTNGVGAIAPSASTNGTLKTASTKAATTLTCDSVFAIGSSLSTGDTVLSCTGSISVTFSDNAQGSTALPASTVISMVYSNFSVTGSSSGTMSLSGTLSMTVLEAFAVSASQPSGKLRIVASNLSGSENGTAFGPESYTVDITFANGTTTATANGERLTSFDASYADDANFTITSGQAIEAIEGGYLQVGYSNWQVVNGVPQTGSSLTATGTNGSSATVQVLSTTSDTATVRVSITAGGTTTAYTVLAAKSGQDFVVQ